MLTTPPGKGPGLLAAALILVPALCCGLPLLIASGVLGALGSALGNPWLIAAAVILVAGAVASRRRGRARSRDR